MARRQLLSISHSYVVALNRRLAHELSRLGRGGWDVTAVAPSFFHGDLRDIRLEPGAQEQQQTLSVPAHLTRSAHLFFYGPRLASLLSRGWSLVHCWEEPYVLAGAQVALLTPRGTPLVFATAQNLDKRYPPPFRQLERYTLARCSGWIAWGHTVEQALIARPGYPDRRRTVIPMGVDVELFAPDRGRGRAVLERCGWSSGGPPVVGYLGRFVPQKGLEVLIEALERVAAPWRALFVGDGPLRPKLEALAARQPERVRILPGVAHDEVPAALNAMDVLCAPSQTTPRWREQFGRMLVEALACGVPVIASDSGEIPFTLGDCGVILPEREVARWAGSIEELVGDPARRRELAQRGRGRAETRFAWPVVARAHLDFFEAVLGG